ncbi:hypothetical protein LXA43DRAFT_847828, partial [Ganoderma leucocontextum]
PSIPQTPIPDHISVLRTQLPRCRLLSRGMPAPDWIQQAIHVLDQAIPNLPTLHHGCDANARGIDGAVDIYKSTDGTFLQDDVNLGIYLYLRLTFTTQTSALLCWHADECLRYPSIMPVGLDHHQIIEERSTY